jgi:hypothetical protein
MKCGLWVSGNLDYFEILVKPSVTIIKWEGRKTLGWVWFCGYPTFSQVFLQPLVFRVLHCRPVCWQVKRPDCSLFLHVSTWLSEHRRYGSSTSISSLGSKKVKLDGTRYCWTPTAHNSGAWFCSSVTGYRRWDWTFLPGVHLMPWGSVPSAPEVSTLQYCLDILLPWSLSSLHVVRVFTRCQS